MKGLRYSLLTDGSSDRVLMRVIKWALHHFGAPVEQANWADLSVTSPRPHGLAERALKAIELYPCDVLFVHRDAEGEALQDRLAEIEEAVAENFKDYIPIVPVRMTEAWLLHDTQAIRMASGNPNGKVQLNLPKPSRMEAIADPKKKLFETLLLAAEANGRRRRRLERVLPRMRFRVADLIDDFGPLMSAPAFKCFIDDLEGTLGRLNQLEV